ncbi:hypothetical protein MLD38_026005 [Melastoma candidum]|uniref:Uncharacterized protein n=1 Tax=Melastoma candidum TaxID=119954 RepID=A0ACB9NZ06_9MYRT|nr:hypothetical protein MLD38_026005 [Melastoma candidum]
MTLEPKGGSDHLHLLLLFLPPMADQLVRPLQAAREEEEEGGGGEGHNQHGNPQGRSGGRKGRGFRTPRCQVEGCSADLTDSKAYYSRHKVCGPHSKSPHVVVNGLLQRFCQQCSRFHLLNEFDSEKRSCRRRLAGHNERRRKPAPGSLLPSRYPRLAPSSSGSGSQSTGFQIELASPYPRPQSTLWPSVLVQGSDQGTPTGKPLPLQRIPPHPPYVMFNPNSSSSDPSCFTGHEIHFAGCFPGVITESSCALSLLSNQSWDLRNQASSILSTGNVTGCDGSRKIAGATAASLHDAGDYSKITWPHLRGPEPGEFEDPQHRKQFQEQHQSVQPIHWSL